MILKSWRLTRMTMSPRCMAGGRNCSAMMLGLCDKEISPSPWKMAKLWWSSWRRKNEKDCDRIRRVGPHDGIGLCRRLCQLLADHRCQRHAGKDLVQDRRLLRDQGLAGHDLFDHRRQWRCR